MHDKALGLLRKYVDGPIKYSASLNEITFSLSEKEDDPRDKLMPSVSYLQKLGPEHLEQIFKSARWVFEQNRDIAFEVFLSLPY